MTKKGERWRRRRPLRFHYLDESEHLVRSFVGVMLIFVLERMVGLEIFAPELIDLKAALVNVKMNVTLLKIRRAGLPNLGFGVQSLNCEPRSVADPLCVLFGRDKQNLEFVVVALFVDFQNNTTNSLATNNDAVGLAVG